MRSALLATAAALALWGAAAPASATPLQFSFSGTVVSGFDGQDLFTGGDLTGQAYTVVETFADAPQLIGPPSVSQYFNTTGNFIDISITIGAETSDGGTNGFAAVTVAPGKLDSTIAPNSLYLLTFTALAPDITPSTTSFTGNASNAQISGSFSFGPFGPPGTPGDGVTSIIFGNSTAVSAVPVPAALPMMGSAMIAFGAIGFGLTRNRKTALSV